MKAIVVHMKLANRLEGIMMHVMMQYLLAVDQSLMTQGWEYVRLDLKE